ncbi:MAG: methylated-DNA--[protein]-cysteine S-methyltransferase [Anaerolineales bacterium]|nr:methylated-DNA--[protein]-cysteine S-methyltransferase [Anaerolineales bacterium]
MGGKAEEKAIQISSQFGDLQLWWVETDAGILVRRLWLPGSVLSAAPSASTIPGRIETLAEQIRRKISGERITFDLSLLDWTFCGVFQQRVLQAEHAIPHGRVSTYGRIAAYIGSQRGGRAVGSMLAANPFPLLIPCHRAVRSSGELGGFQGGLPMKRALLEMEGVSFLPDGRVNLASVFY